MEDQSIGPARCGKTETLVRLKDHASDGVINTQAIKELIENCCR